MTSQRDREPMNDVLRSAGATVLLLVLVVGVPVALVALAPVYVPEPGLRDGASLGQLLLKPDDGSLLFAVVGLIAWLAWATFAIATCVELVATLRRVASPRLPVVGGMQRTAARLIAATALLGSITTATTATATVARAAPALVVEQPPARHAAVSDIAPPGAAVHAVPAAPKPAPVVSPVVTVERGDTLWSIAERHLGSGTRYTEIRDLNTGRRQSDGRTLTDVDWILPGWTLALPPDAAVSSASSPTSVAPAGSRVVTVAHGDSLWSLAELHLGDGARYTEIFDLNQGRAQTDGGVLTTPDMIRPGWTLDLPGAAATPAPEVTPKTAPLPAEAGAPPASTRPAPGSELEETPPTTSEAGPTPAAAELSLDSERPARSADPLLDELTDESVPSQVWFIGLTALGAAGLLGELARRRHLQRRARRPGELVPLPAAHSGAARAERELRAAPASLDITALRTALANLACRCFEAGLELPRVGALVVDEHEVALILVEDAPVGVEPFEARSPRTWVATHSDIVAEAPIDDPEQVIPYPLLVVLGHTETGTLVVNLEAAGTLTVTGDPELVDEVVAAIVVEAATSELSGQLAVLVDHDLADLVPSFEQHRLRLSGGATERIDLSARVAEQLAREGLDDTLQARGDRQAPDTWLPVLCVERGGDARSPSAPWSGVALVSQDPDTPGWRVSLSDDGVAVLSPLGIDFGPQRLSRENRDELRALLEATVPPTSRRSPPDEVDAPEPLALLRQSAPPPRSNDTATPIVVRVLGHVEISGLPSTIGLSPRMIELLVYLTVHGPATGAELDDVLWNGARISPGTRNALVYRTRQKVGEAVLPRISPDGLYRVGDHVTSDWEQFRRFSSAAAAQQATERMEGLRRAMALVRNRPFSGVSGVDYTWSDNEGSLMASVIADVALELGTLLLRTGQPREALAAALQGLSVEPYSEPLQELAVLATTDAAGPAQAETLRRRFIADLAVLDPGAV